MYGSDLIDSMRRHAAAAAVNIAGACLTDDQLRLLATLCAGKSSGEILAVFNAVLPAETDRTGITLPFLTTGPYKAFAQHAHELVVPLVAAYWRSTGDLATAWASALKEMPQGALEHRSIGSRTMDGEHDPAVGVSPRRMREWSEAVSPTALWSLLGFTPRAIGVGYSGLEELKGHIPPASGPSPGSRVSRDVSGGTFGQAAGEADTLLETGKIPTK